MSREESYPTRERDRGRGRYFVDPTIGKALQPPKSSLPILIPTAVGFFYGRPALLSDRMSF